MNIGYKMKKTIDQQIAEQKAKLKMYQNKEQKIRVVNKKKQTLAKLKSENFQRTTAGRIVKGLGIMGTTLAKNVAQNMEKNQKRSNNQQKDIIMKKKPRKDDFWANPFFK